MSQAELVKIVSHLMENAKKLQFGTVSLVMKVHSNRITAVSFETTSCLKERKEVQNET